MKVAEISVIECSKGEVLASDVYNASGVILVTRDTVMNEYIKEKLIDLGVINISIYKPIVSIGNNNTSFREFKKNYKDIVLHTKEVLFDLVAGKPLDYQKVTAISIQIHKSIKDNNNIIRCLAEVRSADEYTYTHCVNTAFYAMLIAKGLKMTEHETEKAIQSGLLHDIGKSRISSTILCKGDILTKEEYEVIKTHTILGYEMVEDIQDMDYDIKRAILLHHERIDGSGYPLSILEENITVYSKIVAVADVFDAMTSDRVYRKRLTPFEAFGMFETLGIVTFDMGVLRVFQNNLAAYLVGASVLLSNGEIGEIVYAPLQNFTGPIVKNSSGYLDLSKENTIKILSML